MVEISLKAYGKINIGLDVIGRRDDGYHMVRMIMQTVGIHDVVTVKRTQTGISLTCTNPLVPTGERNIAWKAAARMMEVYGITGGVSIHIEKNIPMAAGMAGGSTDAAAVILAMNELFDLQLTIQEMDRIAVRLGADVPFCLRRGTYLSEGIGELLTRLKDAPDAEILVVNPPFEVSTAGVYHALDEIKDPPHPDIDRIIETIGQQDIEGLAASMGNILELVTEAANPLISEIKEKMLELGAMASMMTGSGPTVFAVFARKEDAEAAYRFFKENNRFGNAFLTNLVKGNNLC